MVEDGFTDIGNNVGVLKGSIDDEDLINLKKWLWDLKHYLIDDGILLIDSGGGRACPDVLLAEIQVPLHTHIIGHAFSFAALVSITGSYVTTHSEEAMYMFHAPRTRLKGNDLRDKGDNLYEYIYRFGSLIGSILPAGGVKNEIGRALTENKNVVFSSIYMWRSNIVDDIVEYTAEELRLEGKFKDWYEKEYLNGR